MLDAAVRSFAPVEPLALRWQFPLWVATTGVDPARIKGRLGRTEERQSEKDREGMEATIKALRDGPATSSILRQKTAFRQERQKNLLNLLISKGDVAYRETTIGGINAMNTTVKGLTLYGTLYALPYNVGTGGVVRPTT